MNRARILGKLRALKVAARELRSINTGKKDQVLKEVARLIRDRAHKILEANQADLAALGAPSPAFRDRLMLNPSRLELMRESLKQVCALPDPVNEIVEKKRFKNGLLCQRIRSPLGVVLVIFESRPNVAMEAFSLAFKSGNIAILRGGKESMRTTGAFYAILSDALERVGFSKDSFWGITDSDRNLVRLLLQQKSWIDIVIPRGGEGLIDFVEENSRIPIIKNDRGLCHVYVHADADLVMARRIVANAKIQRPGVCNAMETLLVHKSRARKFLPRIFQDLSAKKVPVEWFGCPRTIQVLGKVSHLHRAQSKNWDTEYLDLKMNCRVVDSLEQAIAHIEEHGSKHSEAIITRSKSTARRFLSEIDAAAVYWNASTRFTDGFEMGLGGEIGISTQKLHVRGPVGLRELTSARWVIEGRGQVRGYSGGLSTTLLNQMRQKNL